MLDFFMFRFLIAILFTLFSTILFIEFKQSSINNIVYPTEVSFLSQDDNNIEFPLNFFSGAFLLLNKSESDEDSNATAFSVSSQNGYWLTAAHAVSGCWGVLIDQDGENYVFVDEVVLYEGADIALLKTPISSPSMVSLSRDSWVPKNGYVVGYSGNKINFANAEVVGWTKAYDKNENYVFDVIVWKPDILLDNNRTFGLSGSPIMDYDNNVVGVLVAIDEMGLFASVPTYFIDSILSNFNVDVKKLEVPVESVKDLDFFAENIAKFESSGSIKKIKCIRKPDQYIKDLADSYTFK